MEMHAECDCGKLDCGLCKDHSENLDLDLEAFSMLVLDMEDTAKHA